MRTRIFRFSEKLKKARIIAVLGKKILIKILPFWGRYHLIKFSPFYRGRGPQKILVLVGQNGIKILPFWENYI